MATVVVYTDSQLGLSTQKSFTIIPFSFLYILTPMCENTCAQQALSSFVFIPTHIAVLRVFTRVYLMLLS